MVKRRREEGEIVLAILKASLGGAKKTHIQYRANINSDMLNRYFDKLLKSGYIEESMDNDGDIIYCTTEKGLRLLKIGKAYHATLLEALK